MQPANPAAFFAAVRTELFRGAMTQSQVDGTNSIMAAWPDGTDLRWVAYSLATAFHETAQTMQPIEEYGKGRGRAYGHPAGPWHQVYDGRGLEQLTWEANYRHATQRLRELDVLAADLDLERIPDLAMDPQIAAAIMVYGMSEGWFTGKKLSDFFNDNASDWVHAREIINRLDKAAAIASYALRFWRSLKIPAATAA